MTRGTKVYVDSVRHVSSLILSARKKIRLKQEVLAMLLGCSRSYISKIESGVSLPSAALAAKLEQELSIPKGKLVRTVNRMKEQEGILKKHAVQAVRNGYSDGLHKFMLKNGHKPPRKR